MCLSPHEMSTTMIETVIEDLKRRIAAGNTYWQGRLEGFERILKERAEAGTI